MANLQSGTRIYGTANVDTQINVATGNAVINSTGFFVNTFIMASNTYVQTLSPVGYVSNSYASSATGLASNTYLAATFASNTYVQTLSTGVSNSYATATFTSNAYGTTTFVSNNYYSTAAAGVSNSYAVATYVSNSYATSSTGLVSNTYLNNFYAPVSNSYFRAYPQTMTVAMSNEQSNLVASSTLPAAVIRLPYACTLISPYIRIALTNAPAGSAVTADVRLVGTGTIISGGSISVAAGSNTSAASIPTMSTTSFADDAQLQFFITSVGSTTAGSGLKATLYYIRTT